MQMLIDSLEECPRVQVRRAIDAETVERYQEGMKSGAIFPPLVVFREPDTERYLVADGHQRLQAARDAKLESIEVNVRDGDETDALECALGCNAEHGLPRTQADMKNAVHLLMTNPALRSKYRTHQEKADLLRFSLRTFTRYHTAWKESNGLKPREPNLKPSGRGKGDSPKNQGVNPTNTPSGVSGENGNLASLLEPDSQEPDDMNRKDFDLAIELLNLFPDPPEAVAKKYITKANIERVRTANKLLTDALEAAES